ncbi:septum formation initiator family protein [Streptomyces sp. NPDC093225]|uniref:FtsB family cell division protein n=1 Tax=Streptomyces sp. NPDC093225 TaxID=3366034 RepID=UPI003829F8D3
MIRRSGPATRPGRKGQGAGAAKGAAAQAARTPFVLLVVALLGGGLITLLLLNSALNEGSFQLSRLKKETTSLTDEQQALQRDVDSYSAPDALERQARRLGLVAGGSPVFLGPDGKVGGVPSPAARPTAPATQADPAAQAVPPAPPSQAPATDPSPVTKPAPTPGR